jgi:ubiquinone/menaquinone biosynthesis C-methylase UbiE
MIKKLTIEVIKRLKIIETKNDFKENYRSIGKFRDQCYPINRNLSDYKIKLPDLGMLLTKSKSVLDIGTGNGIAISEINEKYNCDIVGTSIQKLKNQISNIIIAEASFLPFQSESFDLVISVHGITFCPNQKQAIKEALRVTKTGGFCLLRLLKFSDAVSLWFGNKFWDEVNISVADYRIFEFDQNYKYSNCKITVQCIHKPNPFYDFHYYIKLQKL